LNRKVFQDFANTLPQMLVGWRMGEDLETLADLPDGTLSFDVLSGTASHSVAGALSLHVAEEMQSWLQHRLVAHRIPADTLCAATLVAEIRTDRIATDRKRIVSFDFTCSSRLVTADRTYEGRLHEKHAWHSRSAGQPTP
jgi:hypothetical protein